MSEEIPMDTRRVRAILMKDLDEDIRNNSIASSDNVIDARKEFLHRKRQHELSQSYKSPIKLDPNQKA